jgi:dye decolorizing peroxidase
VLPGGAPDAGLMFLAYQADPRTGFVPIQQKLSGSDALGTFIVHESSALFAVPAIPAEGGYPGRELFEG